MICAVASGASTDYGHESMHSHTRARGMNQIGIAGSRARVIRLRLRMWSAALQPGSVHAARLANLALAGATARWHIASVQCITTSRLARAAAASDTSGAGGGSPGRASLQRWRWLMRRPPACETQWFMHCARDANMPRRITGVRPSHRRGTCRRVAKRRAGARRWSAGSHRGSTLAARADSARASTLRAPCTDSCSDFHARSGAPDHVPRR